MLKLFHYLKITLIALLGIAILNDIGAYFYFDWSFHLLSDVLDVSFEVLLFALALIMIYKNIFIGNLIGVGLALESLNTALTINKTLMSYELLKFGPQVIFSNFLMLAILLIGILHFILLIHLKLNTHRNGKPK